ncbi:MAG: cyclomaltodextrinase C-terminal domain-containing protein [Mangrovibacterium sp.]
MSLFAVSVFENKGLSADQAEALAFTKRLVNWRKTAEVVHHGKLMHFVPEHNNQVYTYFRYDDKGNKVMVVLNRSNEPYQLSLEKFQEMIPMSFSAKEIISGKEMNVTDSLEVPAREAMILEIAPPNLPKGRD